MYWIYSIFVLYFYIAGIGNAVNGDIFGSFNCTVAAFLSMALANIELERFEQSPHP